MTSNDTLIKNTLSKEFIDLVIRIGLIGFLVYASVKIVSPFLGILLWGLILAVTLYPIPYTRNLSGAFRSVRARQLRCWC